jgi:hypothetical protein
VALPENKSDRLRCYTNALSNWEYEGYIVFRNRVQDWLRSELPAISGRDIRRLLHDYVASGGIIDEQVERRPEYVSYGYHYDLRLKIGYRSVYFETVLSCKDPNDPDDPLIEVVSVHDV